MAKKRLSTHQSPLALLQEEYRVGPGSGIVDLEIDQLDVRPDYGLNAVAVEIVNPAGDGVWMWFDLGLALEFAPRVAGACAKLHAVIP